MGFVFKAQASGTPTPTPVPTPTVLVAQFTSLATPYSTLDSSKQNVAVGGCATYSNDFSFEYATTLLNLYADGTFALGLDNTLTQIPKFSISRPGLTLLTGIWTTIDSSNTKFKLNPNGNLALGNGGWRLMANWIDKYACASTPKQTYVGVGLGTFRVITADISARSSVFSTSGTPIPATLSLTFEGYGQVVSSTPTPSRLPATLTPTPTVTPTSTPTRDPALSATPTPTNTPTATSTNTPTNTATPTVTPTRPPGSTDTPTPTNTVTPTPTPTPTIASAFSVDKKITYKLVAKGAWRATPSPTPPVLIPDTKISIFGSIAGSNVLGNQLPTVFAVVSGVYYPCKVTFNDYNCDGEDSNGNPIYIDKPIQTPGTGNNEINLLVGNYTRSTSTRCLDNKVIAFPTNGNLQSENGVVINNATTNEETRFEFIVKGLLGETSLVSAALEFEQGTYTDGSCASVTPTPTKTPTPKPTSTNTPTPSLTPTLTTTPAPTP